MFISFRENILNMDKTKKIDDQVFKTLDVKVIRRLICLTDKGQLDLVIRKGENNYFLSIDSVPCEKEINDKLMDILFKPEVPQVKLLDFDGLKVIDNRIPKFVVTERPLNESSIVIPKKKGRPAKVNPLNPTTNTGPTPAKIK